ncbi:ribophorin II (RPN2) family protein [Artemisia annua]|uniref:Dolichyl-diphosphooligosaccharide--protein glycosyltransferase subunit 2 n=1 Tax=Artemisia annua TaxID=35608 RepID=A0A2U1LXC3_ARTAN|nr:ribophorin II (RPN2) family protein [Artemisia annua]
MGIRGSINPLLMHMHDIAAAEPFIELLLIVIAGCYHYIIGSCCFSFMFLFMVIRIDVDMNVRVLHTLLLVMLSATGDRLSLVLSSCMRNQYVDSVGQKNIDVVLGAVYSFVRFHRGIAAKDDSCIQKQPLKVQMKLFQSGRSWLLRKLKHQLKSYKTTGPGASGHQGPLSATSAVVRGLTAFAATSGSLNIPEDKILGLARFFLGIGIPGNSKDLYYQIDALSCLENNGYRLSLTSKDKLKVRVSTVLGSSAPPLSVKLMQVFSSGSKDASVLKQELHFDPKEAIYTLEALPEGVDIGRILLH